MQKKESISTIDQHGGVELKTLIIFIFYLTSNIHIFKQYMNIELSDKDLWNILCWLSKLKLCVGR